MVDITTKSLFTSAWIVAVVVIALLTTGLLPVVLGAILVGLVIYVIYAMGVRIHRRTIGKKEKTEINVGGDDGY